MATFTFSGVDSVDLSDPSGAAYAEAAFPGPTDDVVIDTQATAIPPECDSPMTIRNLTINDAFGVGGWEGALNGNLTVTGAFSLSFNGGSAFTVSASGGGGSGGLLGVGAADLG